MDRFLLKRKSANEAEVEEVHVEENLAAPTTKRNNVRVFKFNEKWKDGRLNRLRQNKLTCHCFYHFITNIVNCKTTVQFCYR